MADEALVMRAGELAAAVKDFQEELGIASKLEGRTTETERVVHKQRRWIRLTAMGLALDLILTLGGGFLYWKLVDQEHHRCVETRDSWDTRIKLIEIQTRPVTLSPEVAKLFPADQTESLRLQIDQANRTRVQQRAELIKANGTRPHC